MPTSGTREPRRKSRGRDDLASAATRYEVVDRLGEGTLFVVYRVRDREGNELALKALKSVYSKHPEFSSGLLEAAGQVTDLTHPRLARVLEADEEDNTVFLVEELVGGPSLETYLKRGSLYAGDAHGHAVDIAEALAFLHGQNITHGDLRPRQLLFEHGHLKVSDYCLAPAYAAAGLAPSDVQHDAAYYMAPERSGGAPATVASDLYSLGAVLYRMLAGRVPFDGPSPLAIAMRHRNDEPLRPSQFNPDCPLYLEEITLRLLAKRPEHRYASAEAVLRDLKDGARSAAAHPPAAVTEQSEEAYGERPRRAATVPVHVTEPTVTTVTPIDEALERKRIRRTEGMGALLAAFWVLVSMGLFVGIIWGAVYFWSANMPREVMVPTYAGMNEDDARRVLEGVGLKYVVGREAYDPKRPAGTVIGGDIQPGRRVREGREVTVTVSRGEEPIKMYNFNELSVQRARQIIVQHGLRLGQITEQYHTDIPSGYICGQYPEANQPFKRSEPINLIVSKGPMPSADSDIPAESPDKPLNAHDGDTPLSAIAEPQPTPAKNVMVSRAVRIRVAIPNDSTSTDVTIMVTDAQGEHIAYRGDHQPGDLIDRTIRVTRQQGTTATVRVYLGDSLLREQHV